MRRNQKQGRGVPVSGGGLTAKRDCKCDMTPAEKSCRSNWQFGNLLILLRPPTLSLNTEPRVAKGNYRGLQICWELRELFQNTNKFVTFSVTGGGKKSARACTIKTLHKQDAGTFLWVKLVSLARKTPHQ